MDHLENWYTTLSHVLLRRGQFLLRVCKRRPPLGGFLKLCFTHSKFLSVILLFEADAVSEAKPIEGLRVQFLPVFNPLNDEGVQTANSFSVNDVIIQVMAPEYLVANMLETGRKKDHTRIAQFFEADVCDREKLDDILTRHNLKIKLEALQKTWDAV